MQPKNFSITNTLLRFGLILMLTLGSISVGFAQGFTHNDLPFIRYVRTMDVENTGHLYPGGLVYSTISRAFFVI